MMSLGKVQQYIDELFAPTPVGRNSDSSIHTSDRVLNVLGQEPKMIQLIKSVTWFSVIVLVLVEIVVSIKVGGMPFELGKVKLPEVPSFIQKL